jgi:type IX secretion system PorP/SprF family membrane protein
MLFDRINAQQTPVSEMYMIDYIYANPAETGRKNCLIARLSDIHQWFGIKDAPNLQTLAIQKGFKKEHSNTYHGLGGMICRDQNGHYKSTGIKAMYSFHVLLNEKNKTFISFGLAGEYAQRSLDETGFLNYNSDPALTGNDQSMWNPNADFGIVLNNANFSSGIAILDLFSASNPISEPVTLEQRNRKYSLFACKMFALTHNMIAEPSIMLKTNEALFSQVDINTKLFFDDFLWLGISYRHILDVLPGKPLTGLIYAGVTIHRWSIDYSFTYNMGSLQKYHYGTHGLTISYKICTIERGALPCPAFK